MMATIDPINIRMVNFSFKKMAANTLVKIGVVAKINADVVGSAVCNPIKKDHWFIKTPITPRKKTASKSDLLTRLKYFLYEDNPIKNSTINKSLSMVSRAGEKSWTNIFPNTKLLPHTMTQNVSQAYAFNIFITLPTTKCQLSYFILTWIFSIHYYLDILKNEGWAIFNGLK